MMYSKELFEAIAGSMKNNIDITKRYRIIGMEKDLIDKCQVCGTKIRNCIIMVDDLSNTEIIVGSECASKMSKQILGKSYSKKQVERLAQKAQREREKQSKEDKFWNIYKDKDYEVLKRLFTQMKRAYKGKNTGSTLEKWKVRFDNRLSMLANNVKMSNDEVLDILKWRGWEI